MNVQLHAVLVGQLRMQMQVRQRHVVEHQQGVTSDAQAGNQPSVAGTQGHGSHRDGQQIHPDKGVAVAAAEIKKHA